MSKKIPLEYYQLYGNSAPEMFRMEQIEKIIENARNKNKFWGNIVEKYYVLFRGYLSDKKQEEIYPRITKRIMDFSKNRKGLEDIQQ